MAEVVLQGVGKRFGSTEAVSDLSLQVGDGEFLVLLGPTGAGKTTTLRLVAGLERPDAGRVFIGGRDMTYEPPAARDVSFVFQQYSLYPHLTVYENLAFPLRSPARAMAAAEVDARVREIARSLHMEDKLENRATQLSGGRCSASPSAAPWYASLPSISWTSPCLPWTPSCARNCASN